MNGLSCSELCYLFCCPPCPSRIAAKLAFLPPEPTYTFEDDPDGQCTLRLTERSEWQYGHQEMGGIEVFRTRTRKGNSIACMYIKNSENPAYTILFSHGNAVDIGQMSSFYVGLGNRVNCNVFAYDYSGYGQSTGSPSEANIYADIEAAWNALCTRYNLAPNSILVYGQSIGTVATIDLASRREVGGVILHSPLMSGMRVAFPKTQRSWCCDPFPSYHSYCIMASDAFRKYCDWTDTVIEWEYWHHDNRISIYSIQKISRVTSPVLVIHGTDDEVIDISHGIAIYEGAPQAVDPLWVEGAGHNDVELYPQYLDRLRRFIEQDLASH